MTDEQGTNISSRSMVSATSFHGWNAMRAEIDELVATDPYFSKPRTASDGTTIPEGRFYSEMIIAPRPI